MEFEITPLIFGFLMCAAFCAAFIDSIAGGGGLISLPSLLITGCPPHLAMGTSKFVSSCGTSFVLFYYAKNNMVDWSMVAKGAPFALAGSVLGTRLALAVSPELLGKIIIFLLPAAALIIFSPWKKPRIDWQHAPRGLMFTLVAIICGLVGVYDGFFGPGAGTFLIIGLNLVLGSGLVQASGTAKAFNLASNVGSFFTFLLSGQVIFSIAAPMALAGITGGILGSRLAVKKGAGVVKRCLYVSLSLLFITLIWRYYGNS